MSDWRNYVGACSILAVVGLAAVLSGPLSARANNEVAVEDQYADLPLRVTLNATIRDMQAASAPNGHPDFESFGGTKATVYLVKETLGDDGKPVLANDGVGKHIDEDYRDKKGRPINPGNFKPGRGHIAGTYSNEQSKQITSESSFYTWYNDTPGVNVSKTVEMVLNRQPNTNRYVFDSATDQPWASLGGFFPINGELFGNYGDWGKNFHFTTQLEADFVYSKQADQVFTFSGDDDVWVFIDGKLVIDVGGLHPRNEQTVELDDLDWLQDGQTYRFKIFHAERHTTESNFRMETTIEFKPIDAPAISNMFD